MTRLRFGLRKALRRRYGYAALRVLRRAHRAAWADELARSIGPRRYVSQRRELVTLYRAAISTLRRRWPLLDLEDPRAEP